MNHNNNNELGFNEVDGGCFAYESLTQPHHLLPGGIDKTKREVRLSMQVAKLSRRSKTYT